MSTTAVHGAHGLAARDFEHSVLSVVLDLDPREFATAPARASAITSLVDTARRTLADARLEHADAVALAADISRVERYLRDDLDASGLAAVAVICSSRQDLFEVIALHETASTTVSISTLVPLEPLLVGAGPARVCVALVDRRDAQIYLLDREGELVAAGAVRDPVHGRHSRGGWAQANYQRSVENDVDAHLRHLAAELHRIWSEEPYARLVLGGQHETLTHLRPMLHGDLTPLLAADELSVDLSAADPTAVEEAMSELMAHWRQEAERETVARLDAGLDVRPGSGVAVGLAGTLAALNASQIEVLVLAPQLNPQGARCPRCGQLYAASEDTCPGDGTALEPLASLRQTMIREALRRGGEVMVLSDLGQPPESETPDAELPQVRAFGGIGAILRWDPPGDREA